MRLNPFQRSQPAGNAYPQIRSENNIFYAAGSPTPSELRVQFSEGEEQRSITALPWDRGGPGPNQAVDTDRALTLVPVYAAVRLLADAIASLPLHLYRKKDDVPIQQPDPSLLVKPEINGQLYDWLHRMVTGLALRGNAYGLITARDSYGTPTMIEWLDPDWIYVLDRAYAGPGSFLQPLWYYKGIEITPRDRLLHIPWFTMPWRVLGFSPIAAYAMTANTGLAAQQYSNDWFAAGGVPPGKFKNSAKTIDESEANAIKQRLVNSIRQRKPLVYGSDWDYEIMATPPNESQFIETMRLTASQIASIYGIPPEMIGGTTGTSLAYTTEEHRALDFVTFALQPWLIKIESAISSLFPKPLFVKFSADTLIRQDTLTRHQVYKLDTETGLRSANEMRAAEGWAPLAEPLPVQLPGKELTEPGSVNPASGGGATTARPAPNGKPQPAPNAPNETAPSNGHRSLGEDEWDELARSIGEALHPGSTEHLMAYWAEGEGAAKIGWGVPGDFDRCRAHLGQYVRPDEVDGLCANLHHRALGVWPGREAGHKGGKG